MLMFRISSGTGVEGFGWVSLRPNQDLGPPFEAEFATLIAEVFLRLKGLGVNSVWCSMTNSLSSRSSNVAVGTPRRTGADSPLNRSLNSLLPWEGCLRSGVVLLLVVVVLLLSFGTQDRVLEWRVEPDRASEDAPESNLDPSVVGVDGCVEAFVRWLDRRSWYEVVSLSRSSNIPAAP